MFAVKKKLVDETRMEA